MHNPRNQQQRRYCFSITHYSTDGRTGGRQRWRPRGLFSTPETRREQQYLVLALASSYIGLDVLGDFLAF